MKIEKIQSELENAEVRGGHIDALIQALGNPSEWIYTGEVIDAKGSQAFCACGHPIRFCFKIRHATRGETHVGSTCIDHIALITPELGAALTEAREKLKEQLNEAKAKAKRAAADAENAALWVKYTALRQQAVDRNQSMRERNQWAPAELYAFLYYRNKYNRKTCPEYVQAGVLKKWLVAAIKKVEFVLANS